MDSRESLPPPSLQHQPHHNHHQPPPPPGMMMPPNTYSPHTHHQLPNNTNSITSNNNKNPNFINPNSITHQQRFSFNTSDQYGDGSSPSGGFRSGGYSVEPARKKRGRPRKYSPSQDGNIALGLNPDPVMAVSNVGGGNLDSSNDGNGGGTSNTDSAAKKHRGRPPGSGKKQLDALGVPGVGFTPHVIIVKAGEDIASTIMSFSQQGPRTVCILSAIGSICNVTLRQPASTGGTVTYEGRFEIISLSGSFMHSEVDGKRSKPSGLSISLAGSDGRVLGGGVTGMLVAASPVQVIVGSFIAEVKKPKIGLSSDAPPPNMLNFGGGGAVPGVSPPSEGVSSESSDESGSSPLHTIAGSYNNATQHQHLHHHHQQQQQQQPMQNLPMYSNMGWPGSTINMLPN
ncbi:AT-hook motif nuclear-localized protein 10-like [Rutidosis leptorrhynchoides]|uniref:AT-hook motif nuclear-localized protein 10-like n=1 Tax=Rutidosis leptorrhynchoides TaxID=125765 RepID=UPI003A9A59D3